MRIKWTVERAANGWVVRRNPASDCIYASEVHDTHVFETARAATNFLYEQMRKLVNKERGL